MAQVDQYRWSLPGASIHALVAAVGFANIGPCRPFCGRASTPAPLLCVNTSSRHAPLRLTPHARYVCMCVFVWQRLRIQSDLHVTRRHTIRRPRSCFGVVIHHCRPTLMYMCSIKYGWLQWLRVLRNGARCANSEYAIGNNNRGRVGGGASHGNVPFLQCRIHACVRVSVQRFFDTYMCAPASLA